MSTRTHTVMSGENPWKFVQHELSKKGDCTNGEIAKKLQSLAEENGCDSVKDFQHKYFSNAGSTFTYDSLFVAQDSVTVIPKTETTDNNLPLYMSSPIQMANDCIQQQPMDTYSYMGDTFEYKHAQNNSVSRKMPTGESRTWTDIKANQDEINNLPSDKERVIAYNKNMNESRENYIIVDKKNYTATVYSWDGKVVKEFEVGVGKLKSDVLLKRSYKKKEGQIESTTAGIYTINYRANGHDSYRRVYNNRVFTLSNDGLKDKGVGSGETGVALHQLPKGRSYNYRRGLLDREGVSDANNRFSQGCVNFREEDFDSLAECINGVGTKVYILPEDENNYMTVKNGQLHYTQKEYTGNVPTTTTKNDPIADIEITSKTDFGGESVPMMQTLSDMKQELANAIGLDNDTYNELALMALGIAQQESEFGCKDAKEYRIKEFSVWGWNIGQDLVNLNKWYNKNFKNEHVSKINSRGLTQMKLSCYTDKDVLRLLNKYGITENNLKEGENAAIATMIALGSIYKNELPAIKEQMKKQNVTVNDAILYCWQGKKSIIKNGNATPDQNEYIRKVRSYMNNFELNQYA